MSAIEAPQQSNVIPFRKTYLDNDQRKSQGDELLRQIEIRFGLKRAYQSSARGAQPKKRRKTIRYVIKQIGKHGWYDPAKNQKLADKLGVTRKTIWKWIAFETGTREKARIFWRRADGMIGANLHKLIEFNAKDQTTVTDRSSSGNPPVTDCSTTGNRPVTPIEDLENFESSENDEDGESATIADRGRALEEDSSLRSQSLPPVAQSVADAPSEEAAPRPDIPNPGKLDVRGKGTKGFLLGMIEDEVIKAGLRFEDPGPLGMHQWGLAYNRSRAFGIKTPEQFRQMIALAIEWALAEIEDCSRFSIDSFDFVVETSSPKYGTIDNLKNLAEAVNSTEDAA